VSFPVPPYCRLPRAVHVFFAAAAERSVEAGAGQQPVVAPASEQPVEARPAPDHILTGSSVEPLDVELAVPVELAVDPVVASAAADQVVVAASPHHVVPAEGRDHIRPGRSFNPVASGRPDDRCSRAFTRRRRRVCHADSEERQSRDGSYDDCPHIHLIVATETCTVAGSTQVTHRTRISLGPLEPTPRHAPVVGRAGFEPATLGLKVPCSTS
jgi:hypothetical protein